MNLLAFDTSTEACSAALMLDSEIISRYELAPRRHTDILLPMIDQLMHEAGLVLSQLDAVAFGRGPGAFTGVRIATGIAQGLAYAGEVPLIGISSLATLAQAVKDEATVLLPAIDARMGEIYFATYQSGNPVQLLGDEIVTRPETLIIEPAEKSHGAGSGWETYASILRQKAGKQLQGFTAGIYPDARHMLPLALYEFEQGNILQPEQAAPAYLRDKVTG